MRVEKSCTSVTPPAPLRYSDLIGKVFKETGTCNVYIVVKTHDLRAGWFWVQENRITNTFPLDASPTNIVGYVEMPNARLVLE